MIWNNIIIGIYVFALLLNGYSWFRYNKNVTQEQRKKEGWNSFYMISTLLLFIFLLKRF